MLESTKLSPASSSTPLFHSKMNSKDYQRVMIGIAFVALSAVAAYFCISHSLSLMDRAVTTAQHVQANLLCLAGIMYALAAAVNTAYLSVPHGSYSKKELLAQGSLTLLAPISPPFLFMACGAALADK